MATTAFKIFFSTADVRRFSLTRCSYADFLKRLTSLYPSELKGEFIIRYVDQDGDKIKVTTELEWQEMFRELAQPIKLYIEQVKPEPAKQAREKRIKIKKQHQKQNKPNAQQIAAQPPQTPMGEPPKPAPQTATTNSSAPTSQPQTPTQTPTTQTSDYYGLDSLVAPFFDAVPYLHGCLNTIITPEYQQTLMTNVGQFTTNLLTDPTKILSDFLQVVDGTETETPTQPTQPQQAQPAQPQVVAEPPKQEVQPPKPQPQPQSPAQPQQQPPKPQPPVQQPKPQPPVQPQPKPQPPKPQPPQFPPSKFPQELAQLYDMGFVNFYEVNTLLEKNKGSVERTVVDLLK